MPTASSIVLACKCDCAPPEPPIPPDELLTCTKYQWTAPGSITAEWKGLSKACSYPNNVEAPSIGGDPCSPGSCATFVPSVNVPMPIKAGPYTLRRTDILDGCSATVLEPNCRAIYELGTLTRNDIASLYGIDTTTLCAVPTTGSQVKFKFVGTKTCTTDVPTGNLLEPCCPVTYAIHLYLAIEGEICFAYPSLDLKTSPHVFELAGLGLGLEVYHVSNIDPATGKCGGVGIYSGYYTDGSTRWPFISSGGAGACDAYGIFLTNCWLGEGHRFNVNSTDSKDPSPLKGNWLVTDLNGDPCCGETGSVTFSFNGG